MEKECCETCRSYAEYEGVCCNPESENIADFMCPFECCEEWEGKEDG